MAANFISSKYSQISIHTHIYIYIYVAVVQKEVMWCNKLPVVTLFAQVI